MYKLLAISKIFCVLCAVTNGQIFRRDYYYDQNADGWLKFNPIPSKWEEAVLSCYNEGAILASPINEDINRALSTIMVAYGVTNTPMFTGISNTYAHSEYESMEGVPLSNMCISWSAKPNALTLMSQNNCIAMNANGTVTAVNCSDNYPFTCYRRAGFELNECGPVDNEFKVDNRTGSCYKVVNKLVTWPEAFKICAREGGHLAIINSEAEAEVIWELAKNAFNPTVIEEKYMSIGFRSWGEPRTWITVHGQSLNDAGYAKWALTQPSTSYERCGTMYAGGQVKDGILNDAKCTFPFKFICEIDPKIV